MKNLILFIGFVISIPSFAATSEREVLQWAQQYGIHQLPQAEKSGGNFHIQYHEQSQLLTIDDRRVTLDQSLSTAERLDKILATITVRPVRVFSFVSMGYAPHYEKYPPTTGDVERVLKIAQSITTAL